MLDGMCKHVGPCHAEMPYTPLKARPAVREQRPASVPPASPERLRCVREWVLNA
jgi:hypothetical protein